MLCTGFLLLVPGLSGTYGYSNDSIIYIVNAKWNHVVVVDASVLLHHRDPSNLPKPNGGCCITATCSAHSSLRFLFSPTLLKMVARGLAGAATLAMALVSAGAFAPRTAFVRSPLTHASSSVVKTDGSVVTADKVSEKKDFPGLT
jgi:hypothetical protein